VAPVIPSGKPSLPYGHHWIDDDDVMAVVQALRSDWITQGPRVSEFERTVAEFVGARHAVAVNSGTAALHATIHAIGIGPSDEVITTPLTFAATANCVLYQGARPVFVDVCRDTLNIDPEAIEQAITPRTRAIIAVDYAGQPADLDQLQELARRLNLTLIEDAAHALGASYRGARVGSITRMTTFSFHAVKQLTTGEGGMITTSDDALAKRMRVFRNHGITTDVRERMEKGGWFYEMVELGYNYRLTDIQCALGVSQMAKLDRFLERRAYLAARYNEELSPIAEITVPAVRPWVKHAYHIYPILLNLEMLGVGRGDVFARMHDAGIGVNVHYIPLHLHPYYRRRFGYAEGNFPVAEDCYNRLLTLPLFPAMKDSEQDRVLDVLTDVLRAVRR